jgi:hypothetical protein
LTLNPVAPSRGDAATLSAKSSEPGETTMTFDYHAFRREVLDGAKGIGQAILPDQADQRLNAQQVRRRRARHLMTDEVWQYRRLADGSLIVEIAYGWFLDHPLLGLTVFCVGDLASEAAEWDHSLSGVFHDVPSLLGRLAQLESGGKERLAALAAKPA